MRTVRVATRKSPLALAQAGAIADTLARRTGRQSVLIPVTTLGDTESATLTSIGGTGVFVGAVREAVISGQADVGVHSLKDLPTQPHALLDVAAVPRREDPRDALCARDGLTLSALTSGSRVGTGSPRRAAQLRAHRPDIDVAAVRGNVDSRLRKVAGGEFDAVVLATAGLRRLGRIAAVTDTLEPSMMMPAPGQGALAVEALASLTETDHELATALDELNDPQTHAAVTSERAVLSHLQAGCLAPVGALATVSSLGGSQPEIHLQAVAAAVDGSQVIRMSTTGPAHAAGDLGRQLACELLASGAAGLLGEPTS